MLQNKKKVEFLGAEFWFHLNNKPKTEEDKIVQKQLLHLQHKHSAQDKSEFNKLILFIQTSNHYRYAGSLFAWWDLLEIPWKHSIYHTCFITRDLTETQKSKIAALKWQIPFLKPANLKFLLLGMSFKVCFYFIWEGKKKERGAQKLLMSVIMCCPDWKCHHGLYGLGEDSKIFQNIPPCGSDRSWNTLTRGF